MNDEEEKKLEEKLIPKMWKRLENIRAYKDVQFPYSTYDTNAVLAEVGSEIRQARITEEREKQRKSFTPSLKQMNWINDLRKSVGESEADPKEFTSEPQIDSEIARLKNKKSIQEKKVCASKQ